MEKDPSFFGILGSKDVNLRLLVKIKPTYRGKLPEEPEKEF